jgi:hypothetical protein
LKLNSGEKYEKPAAVPDLDRAPVGNDSFEFPAHFTVFTNDRAGVECNPVHGSADSRKWQLSSIRIP